MPSLQVKIWLALRSGVLRLDTGSPAWPIAWPGSIFEPQAGKPFIAVGKTSATPRRALINQSVDERSGFLTVSAVMKIGQDTSVYEDAAGMIVEHFQGCLRYSGVTVHLMSPLGGTANAPGGYRDGGFWREPVNIPWRLWA